MKKDLKIILFLLLFTLVTAAASLCIGRYNVSVSDVLSSIGAHISGNPANYKPFVELTLWNIRMPRIILAALCGAGLSVAGLTYQSLFSNPLATPDTLGVASGSSFGAALGILCGFSLIGIQMFSLLFGIIAVGLTFLVGSDRRRGTVTTVLAGIVIGSLFSALVSFVKFTADTDTELPSITYWLMGSLDSASYRSLLLGAPAILAGITVLFLLRWRLNILPLGDEEAASTGVNIKLLRTVAVVCSTMITASVVSMCGQVGWVGLLVPHVCRMIFGNDHRNLLPCSVLTGASFMIIVDTAARSMSASEFPVSILTAVIGAPFFIFILRKKGGAVL